MHTFKLLAGKFFAENCGVDYKRKAFDALVSSAIYAK